MAKQELGELYYKITGDTKDLDSSLSKSDSNITSLGKTGVKVGNVLKAAFAGAAVVGVAKMSKALVLAASDAEETQNKFSVVFGDVGDEAEKSASAIASGYGLSETAAKTLLSSTGDILTGFGLNTDAALDLSVQTTQLAADLASFSNAQGGAEAVSAALTSAYTGERDSLKTYGIVINDAMVQAQLLQQEQEGLTFSTEAEAQSYATLTLAMEQSKNAQGDFERSQESFANQTRIAQARIEDLQVSLGSNLLPVANVGVSIFNDFATQALAAAEKVGEFTSSAEGAEQIGEILGNVAGAISAVGTIGLPIFDSLITALTDIITPFGELNTKTGEASGGFKILGAVSALVSGALSVIGTVVGGAITNLISLTEALVSTAQLGGAAWDRLTGKISKEEFRATLSDTGEAWKDLGSTIVETGTDAFGAVGDFVTGFQEQSEAAANAASVAYTATADTISGTVTTALLNAGETATETGETAVAAAEELGDSYDLNAERLRVLQDEYGTLEDIEKEWAEGSLRRMAELTETGITSLLSGFSDIGEALANGELSWNSFASVGLEALSAVLQGLGAQLAAQAALSIASAWSTAGVSLSGVAPALAGSAAAYTAAGVLSTLAGSFEQGGIIPSVPGVATTGDNVMIAANPGEEVISQADPRHSFNNGSSGSTYLQIDGKTLAKLVINDYVNTGKVPVNLKRGTV